MKGRFKQIGALLIGLAAVGYSPFIRQCLPEELPKTPRKVLEERLGKERQRNLEIKVSISSRTLSLYRGGDLIESYPCSFGRKYGRKLQRDDLRTPIGNYYVVSKNERSSFYKSLGISYPNSEDAERGLNAGLIDKKLYAKIKRAENNRDFRRWEREFWGSKLGGTIFIHGMPNGITRNKNFGRDLRSGFVQELMNSVDWSRGCIPVSDSAIEKLFKLVPVGCPVKIEY